MRGRGDSSGRGSRAAWAEPGSVGAPQHRHHLVEAPERARPGDRTGRMLGEDALSAGLERLLGHAVRAQRLLDLALAAQASHGGQAALGAFARREAVDRLTEGSRDLGELLWA